MGIERVEIKDFLVFRGEFTTDFCNGINIFIGGNGTGKTTLLKVLYRLCDNKDTEYYFFENNWKGKFIYFPFEYIRMEASINNITSRICVKSISIDGKGDFGNSIIENGKWIVVPEFDMYTEDKTIIKGDLINEIVYYSNNYNEIFSIYIPEKDTLSNAFGLPETVEYGNAQFNNTEINIIKKARVLASVPEQSLYRKICDIIGGEPQNDGQSFYMKRYDITAAIPFSMEASGYRKFGLLAALIRNEQIKSGTVLFWDEPENSLNPELIPKLVDILLELSRNGVQIFIATHSEVLASYFNVNRNNNDKVLFTSLYKDEESGQIKANSSERFDLLEPNSLTAEPVKLYEKEIEKGLG